MGRLAWTSLPITKSRKTGPTSCTSPRPVKTAAATAVASRVCGSGRALASSWWWTDTPRMATAHGRVEMRRQVADASSEQKVPFEDGVQAEESLRDGERPIGLQEHSSLGPQGV